MPPILSLLDEAPYDFGTPFVDTLAAKNGTKAIDGAFRHPPIVRAADHRPPVVLRRRGAARTWPSPKLNAGEKRQGAPDVFGALSLFFMLMSRRDFADVARTPPRPGAATASSPFRRADDTCVRMAVRSPIDERDATISDALHGVGRRGARQRRDGHDRRLTRHC